MISQQSCELLYLETCQALTHMFDTTVDNKHLLKLVQRVSQCYARVKLHPGKRLTDNATGPKIRKQLSRCLNTSDGQSLYKSACLCVFRSKCARARACVCVCVRTRARARVCVGQRMLGNEGTDRQTDIQTEIERGRA